MKDNAAIRWVLWLIAALSANYGLTCANQEYEVTSDGWLIAFLILVDAALLGFMILVDALLIRNPR